MTRGWTEVWRLRLLRLSTSLCYPSVCYKTKKPLPQKRQRFDSFWVKKILVLDQFLLSSDKRAESFGQKTGVEWFLERLVDARSIKAHRVAVVWQQRDQDDLGKVSVLAKVLADLQRF